MHAREVEDVLGDDWTGSKWRIRDHFRPARPNLDRLHCPWTFERKDNARPLSLTQIVICERVSTRPAPVSAQYLTLVDHCRLKVMAHSRWSGSASGMEPSQLYSSGLSDGMV
jgi:hypothetical protein